MADKSSSRQSLTTTTTTSGSNHRRGLFTAKNLKTLLFYLAARVMCHAVEIISYYITFLFPPKKYTLPPIDDHNLVTPAVKLCEQIKSGHISSEEVVESFIARIKQVNPLINAVVEKRFEAALKDAREIDSKLNDARNGTGEKSILSLPLVGIPLSVKETMSLEGHSLTGGLVGRRFIKAQKNSEALDTLIKAGLIPICLTNIPEMAMWWDSSNLVYGRSNNPHDLTRITGGSSGGEAALLSAGGSVVGIGSDIGGSIRMPANFCGVFGHKTTPFIVSNVGMYPGIRGERESLLSQGPMTRYACDLAPMLKIMAAKNAPKLELDKPVDLSKLKLYYCEDIVYPLSSNCSAEILQGQRQVVNHFVDKFKIPATRVTFDELKYGFDLWHVSMKTADALPMSSQFYDGKSDMNVPLEIFKKIFNMSNHTIAAIVSTVSAMLQPEPNTRKHNFLMKKREDLKRKFEETVGDDGIFLIPCHPEGAPLHCLTHLKVMNVNYTAITTVLGAPITQVPVGMTNEGLPYGLQVCAKALNDRLTIAFAMEVERAFGGWQAPCRITV